MDIVLSRLVITDCVTPSTPLIVLKDISDAHAISYNEEELIENSRYVVRLINTINNTIVQTVKEPYDLADYKYIARFVNKHYNWKKSTLDQAFSFVLQYRDKNKLIEPHINFKYGPQTPSNPDSLNVSVLYGICQANKIQTRFDTTIDEMAANINLFFRLREPNIHHAVCFDIYNSVIYGDSHGYQLINMLSQIDRNKSAKFISLPISNIPDETINIDYEELSRTGDLIRLRSIKTHPKTHTEAVAMAAIYYKMDISDVSNPLIEYQELTKTPFFPMDRTLAKRIQSANIHPTILSNPRLDKVFNPNLPICLYDEDDLTMMCHDEGHDMNNINIIEEPYSLLQTSYLLPTFVHGKQLNITNVETTMLDDIEELEYDNVIVYGDRVSKVFKGYTYGELATYFSGVKRFQNPQDDTLFEEYEIDKLHLLCLADQRSTESDDMFAERLELAEEIDKLKLYLKTNQAQVKQFVDRYNRMTDKNIIKDFLRLLVESAMYMRGWSGQGSYPLCSDDTVTSPEEQPMIDLRVTQSIISLENIIDRMNEYNNLGDLVKELPLIFYHRATGELEPSTNEEEGLTIFQRINIVKGGESGSFRSCIRMSSNRFASSGYYYMRLLGLPLPFNISELANIS